MSRLVPPVVLLLALTACAQAIDPDDLQLAPNPACDAMADKDWTRTGPPLRLKYDVLYRRGGQDLTLGLLLVLDREQGCLRLAGISEWGMKLLDLTVDKDDVNTHFALPALEARSHLASRLTVAVRRIFLLAAAPSDGCQESERGTQLARRLPDGLLTFDFNPNGFLAAKAKKGRDTNWRAAYGDYLPDDTTMPPGQVDYSDLKSGERFIFRLRRGTSDD